MNSVKIPVHPVQKLQSQRAMPLWPLRSSASALTCCWFLRVLRVCTSSSCSGRRAQGTACLHAPPAQAVAAGRTARACHAARSEPRRVPLTPLVLATHAVPCTQKQRTTRRRTPQKLDTLDLKYFVKTQRIEIKFEAQNCHN